MSETTEQNSQTLTVINVDPKEYGLEEVKAQQIKAQFQPMLDKITDLESRFNEIAAMQKDDPETWAAAKTLRKEYKEARIAVEKIHKEQKDFYLKGGRFVDGWKNAFLFSTQSQEKKLELIENYESEMKKAAEAALKAERMEILKGYEYNTEQIESSLGEMSQDLFDNFIVGVKAAFEKKKAEAEAAEKAAAEAKVKAETYQNRLNEVAPLSQFYADYISKSEDNKKLTVDSTEEEFNTLKNILIEMKNNFDAEQEKIRIENERLKKEQEDQDALHASRFEKISKYSAASATFFGKMTEEEFDSFFQTVKNSYEEAEKAKAEAERIKKEKDERFTKRIEELTKVFKYKKSGTIYTLDKCRTLTHDEIYNSESWDIITEDIKKQIEAAAEAQRNKEAADKARAEKEAADKAAAAKAEAEAAAAKKAANAPRKKKLQNWIADFNISIPQTLEEDSVAIDIQKKFEAFKKWSNELINSIES